MATPRRSLSFTKPIETRDGSSIRIYEVFDGRYINGAYYDPCDDVWYPCQWSSTGVYGTKKSALDLVNVAEFTEEKT